MDIEETQVLETTEIIEEQPTEVNENIKYIKNHRSFKAIIKLISTKENCINESQTKFFPYFNKF